MKDVSAKSPELNAENRDRGLLISFDGLDSSGKATQTARLIERLRYNSWTVRQFQSPDYMTKSGQELKLRLQNKIGNWQETPWEEKMAFFAFNRMEHREEVVAALTAGEVVLYDRYVPSSMAFMAVEALTAQTSTLWRDDVYRAVQHLEYSQNRMPREDVSIFLDVPPGVAVRLLEHRKEKTQDEDEYTDHIHVQERLYNEYDSMTASDPKRYARIRCVAGTELLSAETVSELVWEDLVHRFPQLKR